MSFAHTDDTVLGPLGLPGMSSTFRHLLPANTHSTEGPAQWGRYELAEFKSPLIIAIDFRTSPRLLNGDEFLEKKSK